MKEPYMYVSLVHRALCSLFPIAIDARTVAYRNGGRYGKANDVNSAKR